MLMFGLPELTPSTWGFVGLVVGSLLTTFSNVVLDNRRAAREREAELRRENGEIRIACRLIADELDTIADNLSQVHRLGRTLSRPVSEYDGWLPSIEWKAHRDTLARVLDNDETWEQLATVYHNAASLRARALIDGPNAALPPERLPTLDQDAATARLLRDALKAAASGPQNATRSV